MPTPISNDIHFGFPTSGPCTSVTTTSGSITSGLSVSYAGARWKFCPDCGTKLESAWKHCAECGKAIGVDAGPWLRDWRDYYAPAGSQTQQPCAFDGLPPGPYNLVCTCPKCSPRCNT